MRRADLLRGRMAFASGQGGDSSKLLLERRGSSGSTCGWPGRHTWTRWSAAMFAVAWPARGLPQIARAARAAPARRPPGASDLLLDGLATLITDGYKAGTPALRQAVSVFRHGDVAVDEGLRWLFGACGAPAACGTTTAWHVLSVRQVQLARDAGALSVLPLALWPAGRRAPARGEFAAAASLVARPQRSRRRREPTCRLRRDGAGRVAGPRRPRRPR